MVRSCGQVIPMTIKLVIVASQLIIKSQDWYAENQDNVFKWSDMSSDGLLFHREAANIISIVYDLTKD